jgi:hypothetical protein
LIKKGISDEEIELIKIGRHFIFSPSEKDFVGKIEKFNQDNKFSESSWIVLGRDENENKIIEKIGGKVGKLFVCEDNPGPSAIIIGEKKIDDDFLKLIKAYSNCGSLEDKKNFEKFRL